MHAIAPKNDCVTLCSTPRRSKQPIVTSHLSVVLKNRCNASGKCPSCIGLSRLSAFKIRSRSKSRPAAASAAPDSAATKDPEEEAEEEEEGCCNLDTDRDCSSSLILRLSSSKGGMIPVTKISFCQFGIMPIPYVGIFNCEGGDNLGLSFASFASFVSFTRFFSALYF